MNDLYEELKKAGCQIDHHESDLYVEVTPLSEELTRGCKNLHVFIDQIDQYAWYEISFAYTPFWEKK